MSKLKTAEFNIEFIAKYLWNALVERTKGKGNPWVTSSLYLDAFDGKRLAFELRIIEKGDTMAKAKAKTKAKTVKKKK